MGLLEPETSGAPRDTLHPMDGCSFDSTVVPGLRRESRFRRRTGFDGGAGFGLWSVTLADAPAASATARAMSLFMAQSASR
ncbi:hypothetical protein ACFJIW_11855 [Tahibacter sp. UC22_41]|uniref:hypothetical protein n=1 Tax=Tahibacter sp. UC22_41 TaxID=3350178 RepID=UPI0036DC11C1